MRSRCRLNSRRGIALIPALLAVSLAASAGAVLAMSHELWIRHVEALRDRLQTDALLSSGLELACDALEAHRNEPATAGTLALWARRAAIPTESGDTVQVRIASAQAKFNLNRLAAGGRVSESDRDVLRRLLTGANQNAGAADKIAQATLAHAWLDAGMAASVPGVDPAAVAAIAAWITALPDALPVDMNAAPREVTAALYKDAPKDVLDRLDHARTQEPFENSTDVVLRGGRVPDSETTFDVRSRYFEIDVQAGSGRARRAAHALVRVPAGFGRASIVWRADAPVL